MESKELKIYIMQINVKDKVTREDIASLSLQIWYKC